MHNYGKQLIEKQGHCVCTALHVDQAQLLIPYAYVYVVCHLQQKWPVCKITI